MGTETGPTPEQVIGILSGAFMAFVLAAGLWFVWAAFAPRTRQGQGSIPDGCGPFQLVWETMMGPGQHPACLKPGVGYPKF